MEMNQGANDDAICYQNIKINSISIYKIKTEIYTQALK